MAQAKTFVALDVHVSKTVAAMIDRESGELTRQRLSGRASEVAQFVAGLPGPVRVTYEAGPSAGLPVEGPSVGSLDVPAKGRSGRCGAAVS